MASLAQQILGSPVQSVTETALESLVSNSVPESHRLEYKSQLPGIAADDRLEFVRDLAAMANGGGGIIIFGIRDENEVAAELTPVPLGRQVTRLQQLATQYLAPLPGFATLEISSAQNDNAGYLVLEVENVPQRPYAVVEGGTLGFYLRVERTRRSMSEAEVERLYRERFQRFQDARARIEEFSARIRNHPAINGLPSVFIVAVPALRNERLFRPTRSMTNSFTALPHQIRQLESTGQGETTPLTGRLDPIFGMSRAALIVPPYARPRFKSVELTSNGFTLECLREYGWSEFHDDGSYAAVIPARTLHSGPQKEKVECFYFENPGFVAHVLGSLARLWVLSVLHDLTGDVHLRIGISGARQDLPLRMLSMESNYLAPLYDECDVHEDVYADTSTSIEELAVGPLLLQTTKPLLDDIYTAFAWPECLAVSTDGKLREKNISQILRRSGINAWASGVGVEWTSEPAT